MHGKVARNYPFPNIIDKIAKNHPHSTLAFNCTLIYTEQNSIKILKHKNKRNPEQKRHLYILHNLYK